MNHLTKEQKTNHHLALLEALPAKLRVEGNHARVANGVRIRIEQEYTGMPYFMKVKFPWDYSERVKCFRLKNDGLFSYDKIAAHIVEVIAKRDALRARREAGTSLAETRIEALKDTFERDPMLSALNLEIASEPAYHTENGEVEVEVSPNANAKTDSDVQASLRFNGEAFTGSVEFEDITTEQFVALMVVLRAGELNLLDMITLADDSIIGPIIRKVAADMEGGKTQHD